jgi:type IV pilus assembly protein PilC
MAATATSNEKLIDFEYSAVSSTGQRVDDRMRAPSEEDVYSALARANYTPISVKPVSNAALGADVGALVGLGGAKLKVGEQAVIVHQLHQMLRAGIPIGKAVLNIAADYPKPLVADALQTVADRIASGQSLAQAFSGYPKMFNDVFVAYMAAGEDSGDLVEVTARLARILDKRAEISRKVKAVSMYPLLVSAVIVIMLAAIILIVVPQFAGIYESFDAELPAPTQMVVSLSRVFPLVMLISAVVVTAFVFWNKSKKDDLEVGERLDRIRFRLPLFGKLSKKLTLYRWSSTLAGTLGAGVLATDALDLAARSSGSRWVRATTPFLTDAVRSGRPLSSEMSEFDDLYPPMQRKMIETGEETGELARMVDNVSDSLENEVDLMIATMSAKLEVAMLMFMGASVGTILIALYLPILQLSTTLGDKYGF